MGQGILRSCAQAGDAVLAIRHNRPLQFLGDGDGGIACELNDEDAVRSIFENHTFDALIHTAGLTNVDQCEDDPDLAKALNCDIGVTLARLCAEYGRKFVFISTDHLYDGTKPLRAEGDPVSPINMYAKSKVMGEDGVLKANPDALIIRTNFFGKGLPWRSSLTDWLHDKFSNGQRVPAFIDSYFSPISIPLLAGAIQALCSKGASGIFNVGGRERLSKYEFACSYADFFGFERALIDKTKMADIGLKAPRPADMSMDVSKVGEVLGEPMPDIRDSFLSIKNDYDPN